MLLMKTRFEMFKFATYATHKRYCSNNLIFIPPPCRWFMVVERDWFLDKWDDKWTVELSSMCGPATAKNRDVVVPVEGGGVRDTPIHACHPLNHSEICDTVQPRESGQQKL